MSDVSFRIKNVGRVLKLCRVELDLTQDQLAERLNISRSYISAVERGTANPALSKFMIYCDALDVAPEEVLARAKKH